MDLESKFILFSMYSYEFTTKEEKEKRQIVVPLHGDVNGLKYETERLLLRWRDMYSTTHGRLTANRLSNPTTKPRYR